jgi:protein O-mannosyl-transferase
VSLLLGSSEHISADPAVATPQVLSRPVVCVLLLALTLAAYWPTFSNGFVNFDDPRYILQNPLIAKGLDPHQVALAFRSTIEANWHPLTWISHMADIQFFGMNPLGHHASSLLLQGLNVVLLFLLLDGATGLRWRSAMVAALFAVHPLNVECVAWVSERKSLLSTAFLLLAFFGYGWYTKTPSVARYSLVAFLFALGLAAKPMVITFPFLLLLMDYWPLQRLPSLEPSEASDFLRKLGHLTLEKIPLFVLVVASAWVTLYAQHQGGAVATSAGLPLRYRLPNAIYSYLLYILKGIWPVRLAVFYPHPENSLALWKPAAAAVFLIGVSWLVWRHRERRYLLTSWLWYLGTLVPVIGIVQVGRQALADRYAYLPFLGLFVMIVWGAAEVVPKTLSRSILLPATAAALVWFAALTWWQTTFWKNSVTLFGRALAVTSDNYMAENNIGMVYSENGQADLAFAHFQEAERIRPKFALPHYNLGLSYRAQGNLPAAQREFETAIQHAVDPVELVQAHHNLGIVLYEEDQLDAAKKELQAALALGMIDFRQGNYAQSTAEFQKAYAARPSPQAIFWIGRNQEARGDLKGAAGAYETALRMLPTFKEAHDRLVAIKNGQVLLSR